MQILKKKKLVKEQGKGPLVWEVILVRWKDLVNLRKENTSVTPVVMEGERSRGQQI